MASLSEIYKSCKCFSDKGPYQGKGTGHIYLDTYEELFSDKKNDPVSLLEVGYYEGESAVLWSNYFTNPNCIFDFIDINQPKNNFGNLSRGYNIDRIKFHIQDIKDIENNNYFDKKYDIVIDDGCHALNHMSATVNYFKDKLNSNGILVIEDVTTETTSWGDPATYEGLMNLLPFEVYDLRNISGRCDDMLLVYRKL